MAERPLCPQCKRPLAKRTGVVYLKAGETYRGNMQVIRNVEAWHDGARRLSVWDGESYGRGRYEPFCSQTCGLHFGQEAWHAIQDGTLVLAKGRRK